MLIVYQLACQLQ